MSLSSSKRLVELTADGTSTLYVPELDEHYHSVHGARQESEHVFIKTGLHYHRAEQLTVFEVGFGTGLNAWLTAFEAKRSGRRINYYTLEKYPLEPQEYLALNFASQQGGMDQDLFLALHRTSWGNREEIDPYFHFCKLNDDLTRFDYSSIPAIDLVFFDAFAPDKQPEMWQKSIFDQLFSHCNPGAVVVTYCARGQVRRDLQAAGFSPERLPGPPGKREMLRAVKPL